LSVLNASSRDIFKPSQGDNGDPHFSRISGVMGSDKFTLPGTYVKVCSPRRSLCRSLDVSVLERLSAGKQVFVAICDAPMLSITSSTETLLPVSSDQNCCNHIKVSKASVMSVLGFVGNPEKSNESVRRQRRLSFCLALRPWKTKAHPCSTTNKLF
jgi:hypothetical protein